jgi:tetratricopeptide (TPR) repeat protein
LADFQKAWQLKKLESYALGAGTLLQDRKPDSAILFLEEASRALPQSLLLRLSLARAYDLAGQLDKAILICDELLERAPQQVDVLKFKADLLRRKNRVPEAIATLEKAYYITPFDVELNYELAHQYAETKNAKVLRLCDSLIRQDTDTMNLHAEPAYFKGIYYSNTQQYQKAIEMFDQAILRNYYYLNAYIERGRVHLELKQVPEALKTFNLALTLSPKFPDAYYWIGRCQELMGNKEEAKLNYQRAYSLDPEFLEAKKAAEAL